MRKLSLFLLCGFTGLTISAKPVIEEGKSSEWKYWTGPGNVPEGWQGAEFDDKAWNSGAAPIGIGEARLTTTIKTGGDDVPPVALFRKSFTMPKLKAGGRTVVSLCVDDGAAL